VGNPDFVRHWNDFVPCRKHFSTQHMKFVLFQSGSNERFW
jgi:hypothetical protein